MMNSDSTYLLEIKLVANIKKVRKDVLCWCFDKTIDSDTINLKDLVDEITDQYPPGYLEVAHVQYYYANLKTFPVVNTDQELMSMFEKHSNNKVVHIFIAYSDPSRCYEPILEWEGYPSNGNQVSGVEPTISSSTQPDLEASLQNPFIENEYVGVHEEGMYINIEPVAGIVVACNKEHDHVAEDEDEDEGEDEDEEEDGAHEDEDVDEDEDDEVGEREAHEEPIAYDKEDPPMTIGSTYPNMYEFKVALSQHAIKHKFEYNTVKSAPKRCTVYCARKVEDKYPWRLHASTRKNSSHVVVIFFLCTYRVFYLPIVFI